MIQRSVSVAWKAGMNDFMIKPFEPDTLYSLIYRWTVGKGEPAGQDQYIPMNQQTTDIAAVSEIALDVILGFFSCGNNPQLYQQILGTFRDEYSDQGAKTAGNGGARRVGGTGADCTI